MTVADALLINEDRVNHTKPLADGPFRSGSRRRAGAVGVRLLTACAALLLTASALGQASSGQDSSGQDSSGKQDPKVRVEITGIDDPLLSNVRSFLTIANLEGQGLVSRLEGGDGEHPQQVTPAEVRRRHRAAPQQIRQALMPFGYYRPQIRSELDKTDGGYVARYQIDPGKPARLDTVDVRVTGEGKDFPAIERALNDIHLAADQRLVHSRYNSAKSSLYNAAYNNGFLDADWKTSEIRVAPDRLRADIHLVLDTGPRFYFGQTHVEQQFLDPLFVTRFVNIRPGQPYEVAPLLKLQTTLADTGYFSRVEVRAPPKAAGADHRVPVTVITEPSKPQKYSVGVGYGTDTGPRTKLSVLLRRINARGHRLRADLQLSAITQALGMRYEIPIKNYSTDSLSFSVTGRREEIADANTEQYAVGVSQSVNWKGLRRRLYLQLEQEQFNFSGGPNRTTRLYYPGITLGRERADDLQYPHHGYSLQADLHTGIEALLSDVSFTRLDVSAHWIQTIARATRVLVRGEAGALWTDDFAALPPSQRYFAGGDYSIRGYDYQQVGPRNASNDVVGGERLITGSIELDHLIYGNYGAAVFVDAGDAFDDTPAIKVGAGVGFRWRSPIGMVRLDVAHPFQDPDNDFRIHLTIGAAL